MVVTLTNFQIDFGRPGFIVSGAQAPGQLSRFLARDNGRQLSNYFSFRPHSRALN